VIFLEIAVFLKGKIFGSVASVRISVAQLSAVQILPSLSTTTFPSSAGLQLGLQSVLLRKAWIVCKYFIFKIGQLQLSLQKT